MPGMSGLDLQARLNADRSGFDHLHYRPRRYACGMQALRAGAVEFLAKPFDDAVLLDSTAALAS